MTPPAFGSLVFGYFSKEGMEIKLVLHEAWIMVTLHLKFPGKLKSQMIFLPSKRSNYSEGVDVNCKGISKTLRLQDLPIHF